MRTWEDEEIRRRYSWETPDEYLRRRLRYRRERAAETRALAVIALILLFAGLILNYVAS